MWDSLITRAQKKAEKRKEERMKREKARELVEYKLEEAKEKLQEEAGRWAKVIIHWWESKDGEKIQQILQSFEPPKSIPLGKIKLHTFIRVYPYLDPDGDVREKDEQCRDENIYLTIGTRSGSYFDVVMNNGRSTDEDELTAWCRHFLKHRWSKKTPLQKIQDIIMAWIKKNALK